MSTQQHTLVWFRSDLRIQDNTALQAATTAGNPVLACFTATPEQWRQHHMAPIKARFIGDNLEILQQQLLAKGIPLKVIKVDHFSALPEAMLSLCQQYNVNHVYANHEYGVNEKNRDQQCQQLLSERGIETHLFHDQTVLAPGSLLKGDGTPYKVFTPFSRLWRQRLHWPPGLAPTPKKQPLPVEQGDTLDLSWFELGSYPKSVWPAGEQQAHKKLKAFARQTMGDYKKHRDLPAVDGTSSLSPYLAVGVLSPRQCITMAFKALEGASAEQQEGIQCWINEIIWRDFYIHILDQFPRISRHQAFKPATEALPWRHDQQDFERWCEGKTGIPIIDAAMRQLVQTGWMHNRLRMVTAMFLTKNLFIDWRWGEQFFMGHLIDGHLASNNGGWQWSASTGTDAVPYFRIFNPTTQGERFDSHGAFIRRFVPELADLDNKEIHNPPIDVLSALDYPAPMIDLSSSRKAAIEKFKSLA